MKIKLAIPVLVLSLFILSCKQRLYKVATTSMEKTMLRGDNFIVTDATSFKKNDLVVFEIFSNDYASGPDETGHLKKHWEKRVYRLIALSGDTLQIKNGDVFINGKLAPFPEKGMMEYEVISRNVIPEFENSDWNEVRTERLGSKFKYVLPLTRDEATSLRSNPAIESINHFIDSNEISLANYSDLPAEGLKWTVDNYGPVRIPMPGETIKIDSANFLLFKNIPGVTHSNFKIKENLYFVMGDNRHRAADSRYEGLISHSKMYGIAK